MSKDSISIIPLDSPKFAAAWKQAVGDCGLSLTSGVPVVQNYYMSLRSGVTPWTVTDQYRSGFMMMAKGMGDPKYNTPSPIARLSYYKAFGIPPEVQEAQELYYDSLELENIEINQIYSPPPILRL